MIKAQVKVCGVITAAASQRATKDGSAFISFPLKLSIPGSRNEMPSKEVTVSVSVDGTLASFGNYPVGTRIECEGSLTFRKRGENLYLNLHAEKLAVNADAPDSIEGTVEFKGTIGNKIDERTGKKGNPFVSFSAFSTEKVSDGFEFTWVRFTKFNGSKEDILQPKAKIHATGQLELSIYNDRLSIGCRYDSVEVWERVSFNPLSPNENPPF